ncbi:MAG: zinc ABC transporter substrate-binding protein, partial [Novibacillus thermophilus]
RADVYEANFEQLAAQFDELDRTLRNVTRTAEKKEFVVSHAAFGHLAHRYGLEQVAVSGLSPSDEPSSKELQQVIDFAKEHDVHYIMFDVLVSPKVANAVKESIGAEVLRLHSLENLTEEELGRGEDYFSIMKQNVANLEKALNPSNDDGGTDY